MSDQQMRARAPTLLGYSVKSKLEYWKQKDSENQRTLSQESRGSGRSSIDAGGSPFGRSPPGRSDLPQTMDATSPPSPTSALLRVDASNGQNISISPALSPLAAAPSSTPFDADGGVYKSRPLEESDECGDIGFDLTSPISATLNEALLPSTKEQQHQRIIEQVEELKRLEKLEQQVQLLRATNSAHGPGIGSDICASGQSGNHSSYGHSQPPSSREDHAQAVGRIMASVDQLHSLTFPSHNYQNGYHSHVSGINTPGHSSPSSTGNGTVSGIVPPPAAVEKLLTKVEQLRELENMKSSIDRIRAERGRAASSTKSKADGES